MSTDATGRILMRSPARVVACISVRSAAAHAMAARVSAAPELTTSKYTTPTVAPPGVGRDQALTTEIGPDAPGAEAAASAHAYPGLRQLTISNGISMRLPAIWGSCIMPGY